MCSLFFERFVLFFCLKIERFVPETTEIWICGLYTLLAQLGVPHDDFTFSKNILNPSSPHFGYFTRPNFFGMVTPENQLVYNLDANTVQLDEGPEKGANLEKGKAFLQKLYDDLAKR